MVKKASNTSIQIDIEKSKLQLIAKLKIIPSVVSAAKDVMTAGLFEALIAYPEVMTALQCANSCPDAVMTKDSSGTGNLIQRTLKCKTCKAKSNWKRYSSPLVKALVNIGIPISNENHDLNQDNHEDDSDKEMSADEDTLSILAKVAIEEPYIDCCPAQDFITGACDAITTDFDPRQVLDLVLNNQDELAALKDAQSGIIENQSKLMKSTNEMMMMISKLLCNQNNRINNDNCGSDESIDHEISSSQVIPKRAKFKRRRVVSFETPVFTPDTHSPRWIKPSPDAFPCAEATEEPINVSRNDRREVPINEVIKKANEMAKVDELSSIYITQNLQASPSEIKNLIHQSGNHGRRIKSVNACGGKTIEVVVTASYSNVLLKILENDFKWKCTREFNPSIPFLKNAPPKVKNNVLMNAAKLHVKNYLLAKENPFDQSTTKYRLKQMDLYGAQFKDACLELIRSGEMEKLKPEFNSESNEQCNPAKNQPKAQYFNPFIIMTKETEAQTDTETEIDNESTLTQSPKEFQFDSQTILVRNSSYNMAD